MMLQQALRPVQKSASRILLAGANAAADLKDVPEVQPGATTVPGLPGIQFPEPSFAGSGRLAAQLPAPLAAEQAMGMAPLGNHHWRLESRWPSAMQDWLEQAPEAFEDPALSEQQPESPAVAEDSSAAGSPFCLGQASLWHLNQGLPVGTMFCPVFWPVTFVPDMPPQEAVPQQPAAREGADAALDSVLEGIMEGIQMPSRTAASRRQRRRQRTAASPEEVPEAAADSLQQEKQEQLAPAKEEGVPDMLWPSTPESTPPCSPRQSPMAVMQFDWGMSPLQLDPLQVEADECERLLRQLSEDSGARAAVLQQVTGRMWQLASTQSGCRVVQKALEVADTQERVLLALQLQGHVREACSSPHANHVLQKCIELMPAERMEFVLQELKGHAIAASRHRYGCRVLERLIEHCSSSQTEALVDEVLTGAAQLCRHTFGNFVVQHILVHGLEEQRHKVADILGADIQRLARHRVASHVVRCALVHCAQEDRSQLALAMSADAAEFADLAHHHCGSFVVREMKRAGGSGKRH